jgi:large subunit ribosomal protein L11
MEPGTPTPVVITAFSDRSFTFVMKTPPNTYFLLKAAKLDKAPRRRARARTVGRVTRTQLREIAETKMKDMNANDVEAAVRMLAGSPARWASRWWRADAMASDVARRASA